MDYTLEQALPKVYIEKKGKLYDLHWDAPGVEADHILDEHSVYIEGHIDGTVQTLIQLGHNLPDRAYGHRSGYVQGLEKETAELLSSVIETLLHTLVRNRYASLEQEASRSSRSV